MVHIGINMIKPISIFINIGFFTKHSIDSSNYNEILLFVDFIKYTNVR